MIKTENIWREQEEMEQKHQKDRRDKEIKKNQANYDLITKAVKMLMSNADFISKGDAESQSDFCYEQSTWFVLLCRYPQLWLSTCFKALSGE